MYYNRATTEQHVVDGVTFKRNARNHHTHVVLVKGADDGLWGVASWHYSPVTALHAAAAYEGLLGHAVKVERVNHGKAGSLIMGVFKMKFSTRTLQSSLHSLNCSVVVNAGPRDEVFIVYADSPRQAARNWHVNNDHEARDIKFPKICRCCKEGA